MKYFCEACKEYVEEGMRHVTDCHADKLSGCRDSVVEFYDKNIIEEEHTENNDH